MICNSPTKYLDSSFSNHSYGFRPNRSAHQAVKKAKEVIEQGREVMIDIDIEKFFDSVNHDRLMSKLFMKIKDQRVLNLIRKYLNTGIQVKGRIEKRQNGVPQGSPLSPLLSNLYLDDLDHELTKRNHRFVRYADDCKIFVHSDKAAKRVFESITKYLSKTLRLQVNKEKSHIGKIGKFLGFQISKEDIFITKENLNKFKERVRALTKISGGRSIKVIINDLLNPFLEGWKGYFKIQTHHWLFERLSGWIRRRLRACIYQQLKNGSTRLKTFLAAGINYNLAYMCAYSSKSAWRSAKHKTMHSIWNNRKLAEMGLVCFER